MATRTHRLKTLPDYWNAVLEGDKTFEVRRDDRGFQKGDILELVRLKKNHTGWVEDRTGDNHPFVLERRIAYILTGGQLGIEPGYVVIGLKK